MNEMHSKTQIKSYTYHIFKKTPRKIQNLVSEEKRRERRRRRRKKKKKKKKYYTCNLI